MGRRPSIPAPPPAPPPAPDLADQAIREAQRNERQRTSQRRQTFLSGALGDQSAVSSTIKRLLGS